MNAITGQQIRKIYAIGQTLGIVRPDHEDDLHALIDAMTGKGSVKELSFKEGNAVILELQLRQGTPPPSRKVKKHQAVAGGMTEGMQKKVWALMYDLQKYSPSSASLGDRLCGIIKKDLKIDSTPKNPFVWLDYRAGNKLVEILKRYVSNARKKAGDSR
ncbi:regulatory protein GemA [Lachnospiraceae bacterium 54-53]